MVTTNLEKEQIAEADKHEQRKANILGSDASVHEEPFSNTEIVLRSEIWSETPTAGTSFAAPDYGDGYVDLSGAVVGAGGAVGTRHVRVRLHPVLNSGQTGGNSIQTFMAVHTTPKSDNPKDVEAVRIKHLIPPDFSANRTNADEPDVNARGFELALFPAQNNSGALEPFDGYGPIPISASPSDAYGVGDERWTVDYANGIVRLSAPPLDGPTGLFNPLSVLGDIHGETKVGGRLTLFATFYQYTGTTLTDADDVGIVTVGDGTDSYGTYYGPTSVVMQKAIDSLDGYGGTVLLKEGRYEYYSSVFIPSNVRVLGLSHRAEITKPLNDAAFKMFGSNSSIEGLKILARGRPNASRASIEFVTTKETQTSDSTAILENITIKNNHFDAAFNSGGDNIDEPAIGFAPQDNGESKMYRHIKIDDNVFRPLSSVDPDIGLTYIKDIAGSGHVTVQDVKIRGNDWGRDQAWAMRFTGVVIELIEDIEISDSYATAQISVDIDNGAMVNRLNMSDNIAMRVVDAYGLTDSTISDNILQDVNITGGGFSNTRWTNNLIADISIVGNVSNSAFDKNTFDEFTLSTSADNLQLTNNTYNDNVILSANGTGSGNSLNNVLISGNKMVQSLQIMPNVVEDNQRINGLRIVNNVIDNSLTFSQGTVGLDLYYRRLEISDNVISRGSTSYAILFGAGGVAGTTHLLTSRISRNTLLGDMSFKPSVRVMPGYNLNVSDNRFDTADTGVMLDTLWLNSLEIHGNRANFIRFFNFSPAATLPGDMVVRDISIKDNAILGDISFLPNVDASANYFELIDVDIKSNKFEGLGHIDVLSAFDPKAYDYRLTGLAIEGNKLPFTNSYISVFGEGDLTFGSPAILNITVKDNMVDRLLRIGGADITEAHIESNTVRGSLHIAKPTTSLLLNDNLVQYVGINGNVDEGTISNNNIYVGGMELDSNFTNVIMSDNNIDGYLHFKSDLSDSTLSGNNITSFLTFSDTDRVVMTGNTVSGIFTMATADEFSMTSNRFGATVTLTSATNSSFDGNTVTGAWTTTSWTQSAFGNNKLLSTLGLTTVGNSTFTGNVHSGDVTMSAVDNTTITGNTLAADLIISTSLEDSTITNNSASNITLTGTVDITSISHNYVDSVLGFSNTVTSSTIIGNVTERLAGTTAISNSTISGNSVVTAATFAAVDWTGTITDCVISDNVFDCVNSTSNIDFAAMTDSTFTGNVFKIGTNGNIVFSTLDNSVFTDCMFNAAGTSVVTFAALNESRVENCTFEAASVTFTSSTYALFRSSVSGCQFSTDVTLSSTGASASVLRESSFVNNIISDDTGTSDLLITSSGSSADALLDSVVSNNTVQGSCTLHLTSVTGENVMDGSLFNDNRIRGVLVMDHNAAASNPNILTNSTIVGNQTGSITIGANASTGGGTIIGASTIADNRCGNITIGPGAIGATTISHISSTIEGNVAGAITINGAVSGCVIEGNILSGAAVLDQLVASTLSGNTFGSTLDMISGAISGSVVSNNVVTTVSTTTVAAVSDTIFDGNAFNGAVNFSSTTSGITFSGNRCSSTTTFTGNMDTSGVSGNVFTGAALWSAALTTCNISDNNLAAILTLTGNLTTVALTGNVSTAQLSVLDDIEDLNVTGNRFTSMTFNSTLSRDDISITGNVTGNLTINGGGVFNDATIIGNYLGSMTTTATTLSNGVFSSNTIEGVTDLATLLDMSIVGNTMTGDVDFEGTITNCTIVGNTFSGGVSSLQVTGAMAGTTFNSNSLDDGLFTGAITNSVLDGNVFLQNVTLPGVACTRMSFTNNIIGQTLSNAAGTFVFTNCILSNNAVAGTTTLENRWFDCVIADNVMTGVATFEAPPASNTGVLDHSTFSGNHFGSTLNIHFIGVVIGGAEGVIFNSIVSNNKIKGLFSIDTVDDYAALDSVISNNQMDAGLTIENTDTLPTLKNVVIDGNTITGVLDIHSTQTSGEVLENTIITDNTISSNLSIGTTATTSTSVFLVDDSTISYNVIDGSMFIGGDTSGDAGNFTRVNDSTIDGNAIQGSMTIRGLSSGTSISNNTLNSQFILGGFSNSVFSDNRAVSTVTLADNTTSNPAIQNTTISANTFPGAFNVESGISGAVITGNKLSNRFNFAANTITDSVITGNVSAGITSAQWLDVTCTGNRFSGTIAVLMSSNGRCIDGVTFTGNLCESSVTFDKSTGEFTNNFVHSSFTGNTFQGNVVFGRSGVTNEFARLVFNSNSGDGGLTLYSGPSTELDSSMIVGNSMSGQLKLENPSATNYTSPGTSGTGHVMIALNWFSSYSGITFTDGAAVGWGDNTGGTTITAVNGSNLPSGAL